MNRRGFTLLELMVAGIMATIVLGGITTSLSQLGSAKSISRQRLEAYSRCDTALRTIRKDIITILRRGDLFNTRLRIGDFSGRFQNNDVDKDELLIFNGNLRANKEIDFNGEGLEYETQFRVEDSEVSSSLWKRRDAILDDNPIGGGMATPIAEGVISLQFEAYDGLSWFNQWDSDELGIPTAIRATVVSTGMAFADEKHAPVVTLRTIVPIDRVRSPNDRLILIAEEKDAEDGFGITDAPELELNLSGSGSGGGNSDIEGSSGKGGKESKPNTITDPDENVHQIPPPP
jgi:type II secretory pathway component PulJ